MAHDPTERGAGRAADAAPTRSPGPASDDTAHAPWSDEPRSLEPWSLEAQVGFLMRRAHQRHVAVFASMIPELTPTQFSALAQAALDGPISQNELGRRTAMDAATIKGVVDRLRARGLVHSEKDPSDRRRIVVRATSEGAALLDGLIGRARKVTDATLAPLTLVEQDRFVALLRKLV